MIKFILGLIFVMIENEIIFGISVNVVIILVRYLWVISFGDFKICYICNLLFDFVGLGRL